MGHRQPPESIVDAISQELRSVARTDVPPEALELVAGERAGRLEARAFVPPRVLLGDEVLPELVGAAAVEVTLAGRLPVLAPVEHGEREEDRGEQRAGEEGGQGWPPPPPATTVPARAAPWAAGELVGASLGQSRRRIRA